MYARINMLRIRNIITALFILISTTFASISLHGYGYGGWRGGWGPSYGIGVGYGFGVGYPVWGYPGYVVPGYWGYPGYSIDYSYDSSVRRAARDTRHYANKAEGSARRAKKAARASTSRPRTFMRSNNR
jgi:hypothetical protein